MTKYIPALDPDGLLPYGPEDEEQLRDSEAPCDTLDFGGSPDLSCDDERSVLREEDPYDNSAPDYDRDDWE